MIADFFNATVPIGATKQVIKDVLYTELVTRCILPDDSPPDVSREDVAAGEASGPYLPTG